jgi:hypothetical protein
VRQERAKCMVGRVSRLRRNWRVVRSGESFDSWRVGVSSCLTVFVILLH